MAEEFRFYGPEEFAHLCRLAREHGVKSYTRSVGHVSIEWFESAPANDNGLTAIGSVDEETLKLEPSADVAELARKREKYELLLGQVLSDGELASLP